MSVYFKSKNISRTFHVLEGSGIIDLDVPFVPDYIEVKFSTPGFKDAPDAVAWDLVSVTPTTYRLEIGYDAFSARDIYCRVSKLSQDPF